MVRFECFFHMFYLAFKLEHGIKIENSRILEFEWFHHFTWHTHNNSKSDLLHHTCTQSQCVLSSFFLFSFFWFHTRVVCAPFFIFDFISSIICTHSVVIYILTVNTHLMPFEAHHKYVCVRVSLSHCVSDIGFWACTKSIPFVRSFVPSLCCLVSIVTHVVLWINS